MGATLLSHLPKQWVGGILPNDRRKRAEFAADSTQSPVCWFHWNANDARSLCRGENCIPWAQRRQSCTLLPQQRLPKSPKQPQFSPFTPILLHLTGRTTGSDTDEFAKSKENNWIQQQNKGWVFRGLLEGPGGGGKLRRRERETLPWSSCSADSPQPSSFDISPKPGRGWGWAKMRFYKNWSFSLLEMQRRLTAHIPASASLESPSAWARRRKEEEMWNFIVLSGY